MRVIITVPVFYWAIGDLAAAADSITLGQDCLAAVCGILLLAGLWTPLVGIALSSDETWIAFSRHFMPQGHLLVAALGICLAMLGPGAWSVDARLFGRRVFELGSKDV